jgi:hypothetical protein
MLPATFTEPQATRPHILIALRAAAKIVQSDPKPVSLLGMTSSCVCVFHLHITLNLPQLPTLISCLGYPLGPIITSVRDGSHGTVGAVNGSWQQFSSPNLQADFHPQPHIVWVPGFFAMGKSVGA